MYCKVYTTRSLAQFLFMYGVALWRVHYGDGRVMRTKTVHSRVVVGMHGGKQRCARSALQLRMYRSQNSLRHFEERHNQQGYTRARVFIRQFQEPCS